MKMNKSKPKPSWDDGRVIADMNVPGMPWYKERRDDVSSDKTKKDNKINKMKPPTRQETVDIMIGGTFAALLVGLLLCAGIVLFVFICVTFL